MKQESQSSYRQIFKATSIFGGVQVFSILIAVIRSKFIAVFLGPVGMGISGLLTESISLIGALTNFGLSTSAVKNVAAANASGNQQRIAEMIAVLRKWVWITGLLGFAVTLILSPWLSYVAFGNKDYTVSFMVISITLLIAQLSSGQSVILQGMRQIGYLAKAGMVGSVLGLLTSIPLYFFLGEKGIVPSIVTSSITTLFLSWYFSSKIKLPIVAVSRETVFNEGKGMLSLGFMLSLSGLITLGLSYLVRIFISRRGGVADVGLYGAGFSIINSYVGLIFSAMGTDYYPRLAGVAHDNKAASNEINQQGEVALLIIAPILCIFLVYIDWAIILLYSKKFIAINSMIHWAALGIFFKAASWSVGFLLLAKGATKVFFWNELFSSIYLLGLNLAGYYYWGLTGLGISFMIGYIIHLIQMVWVTGQLYGFRYSSKFIKIFFIHLSVVVFCFLNMKFFHGVARYFVGSFFIALSIFYSLLQLNKRLDFRRFFTSFGKRLK